jgi:SAM-dependent methyltransferase
MQYDPAEYGREWAEDYDVWEDDGGEDAAAAVARLLELAAGRPVLEVGAGTGRVAIPQAHPGATVTATDISPEMIAVLRRKDPDGCVDARVEGMEAISGGPYGLIANLLSSLLMLREPDQQFAALRSAAAALEVGGLLVVEMVELAPAPLPAQEVSLAGEPPTTVWGEYDEGTGLRTIHHRLPDGTRRTTVLRRLTYAELLGGALAAGLTPIGLELGWTGTPFVPGTVRQPFERLVAVFRRDR